MMEHETDMSTTKYKKLNMMEYKTDITITKLDKYKKTEQKFNDGAKNRHTKYKN